MRKVKGYADTLKEYGASVDIREAYFLYLCEYVGEFKGWDEDTHNILLRLLFNTEFYWTIELDRNRAEDGKLLRDEFAKVTKYVTYESIDGPCNMLELLIGIAIRMDGITYKGEHISHVADYFWEILGNLLGSKLMFESSDGRIDDRICLSVKKSIQGFLGHKISYTGKNGLFPVKKRDFGDFKDMEIWNQMHAYLIEKSKKGL